jgi:hypothetical protein
VLSRFVEIARAAALPTFVEVFESRLPPEEEINLQDFSVVKQLLVRLAESFRPDQLTHGRLALACLLSPAEKVRNIRLPESDLAEADKAVNKAAAELVRARDPQVEKKRIHFLRTRDVASWADFVRAFQRFRSAKLVEAKAHSDTQAPMFDMFTIAAEDGFEFTEEGVLLHQERPAVSPEEPFDNDSSSLQSEYSDEIDSEGDEVTEP